MRRFTLFISLLTATIISATANSSKEKQSHEKIASEHYQKKISVQDGIGRFAVQSLKPKKVTRYYELSSVSFTETPLTHLTEADKLNGIDQKIYYKVKSKAYRYYDPSKKLKQWSEWKNGTPAECMWLSTTVQRVNGTYKIKESAGIQHVVIWHPRKQK